MFCGKPLIVWSIEAAKDSMLFDEILVSSDDDEIIEIALKHGAKAPFKRPENISDDYTLTSTVIKHAIEHEYFKQYKKLFINNETITIIKIDYFNGITVQ